MNFIPKIAFHTLGCKLNFSETSGLIQQALDLGFIKVDFYDLADIYVINTCSVTENADKECKYLVRNIKKRSPDCKIAIIGCYAQLKPDEISQINGVNIVLGASEKFDLFNFLNQKDNDKLVAAGDVKKVDNFVSSFSFGDRTRTFLKIQDGCDYFCTFCTIPLARGRSRSTSIDKTLDIYHKAVSSGVKEIVLTGVNIGDFGRSENGKNRTEENFEMLLQEIDNIDDGVRIRISSIEPNLLTNNIINIVANSKKIMPHFHIPLQSGSDKILKLMHRKYNSTLYKSKIEYIKEKIPNACIGVDVIVGFPDEDETCFQESYNFVKSLGVSYLHVFTYSERLNTRALESNNFIPINVRRERNKTFRMLSYNLKKSFYSNFINHSLDVLFEKNNDEGFMYGYTDNYIRVRAKYNENFVNIVSKSKLIQTNSLEFVDAVL